MLVAPHRLMNPQPSTFLCLAGAADFDGTNDWLKIGTDMASNADGTQGICSLWINYTSGTAVRRVFYGNGGGNVVIERTAAGKFQATLRNAAGTSSLVFTGSTTYGIGGVIPMPNNFRHVIFAWDTNFSAGNKKCAIYFDGVAETLTKTDASPAFTIKYTDTTHGVGSDAAGANKWAGSIGCFYFNNSTYLDLSVASNLAKFRQDWGGNQFPAYMGSDGSVPTGSQPIMFFNNPFASFGTNLGYGGGYSVQGALTISSPISPCVLDTGGGSIGLPE